MKKINNSIFLKIIFSILILIVISATFAPICSNAAVFDDEDSSFGGQLFKPISKLICGISDGVISALQKTFLGYGGISDGVETSEVKIKTYKILYGPATIFSNKVPALNADFMSVTPGETYKLDIEVQDSYTSIASSSKTYSYGDDSSLNQAKQDALAAVNADSYGYSSSSPTELSGTAKNTFVSLAIGKTDKTVTNVWQWTYNGETYYLAEIKESSAGYTDPSLIAPAVGGSDSIGYSLFSISKKAADTKEIEYSASILQPIIAKWFRGLRLIAMVGLMSVLVYIGIRIIIASTGNEKAKYKKMIGDWLAAMCILFILQYLMSFITTITNQLINVFSGIGTIALDGEDVLMTTLRNTVAAENGRFFKVFAETIMYVALVTLTAIFTFHYLKRLIYLAFLTMIAPLIALTYPLDKIKDGQAQAFTLWIREYTFNTLIPVIHLLIYTIFVSTASTLAETNPIYAIVCIAFIIPAEKFIRKMFGFDKATTVSPLGAAAGGALIMNAINRIGRTNIQQQANQENKPVRTTGLGGGSTWTPTVPVPTPGTPGGGGGGNLPGGNPPANPPTGNPPANPPGEPEDTTYEVPNFPDDSGDNSSYGFDYNGYSFGGNYDDGSTYSSSDSANSEQGNNEANNTAEQNIEAEQQNNEPDTPQNISGQNINMDVNNNSGINIGDGFKEAFFERFNKKNIKGFAKNTGKKAFKGIGRAALGATLGTMALGVGVSTGDLKNSATYALAGMAAGGKLGDRISTRAMNEGIRTGSAFKKGALGGDEYNAKKTIDELRDDRDFLSACRAAGITRKNDQEVMIRQFIGNGITDKEDIVKAVVARKNYEKSQGIKRKVEKDGTVKLTQKDSDGNVTTTTQRIDVHGHQVEETTKRNTDGSSTTTMETVLPNNNRVERTIERDKNGRIVDDVITTIQTREENGQIIEDVESRDRNGNITQRKKRVDRISIVTNKELVDVAKFNQSISDSAWGNPIVRTRILDGAYSRTGDEKGVQRAELLISSMKG